MSDNNENFTVEKVEELFHDAILVKDNKVREVRRSGNYFIKFDHRANHGFAREFAIAQKLRRAGIPVVDHLFYGRGANGNYLVTGAFVGSVDVATYLRNHVPELKFFERIADMQTSMLKKGFLHTDFHMGNLLYNENEDSFALVDVRKIRQVPLWLMNRLPELVRFQGLLEFRKVLRRGDLFRIFRRAGVTNPSKFYEDMFTEDNQALRDEWPRRRRQILSGYLKFTRKEGNVLYNSHATEKELASAVKIPGGKAAFLAGFFLDMANIPHRQLLKYELDTGTAYAEPECTVQPGGEAAIEMMTRLNFYDILSNPSDWCQPEKGLPQLRNLNRVAGESFILED